MDSVASSVAFRSAISQLSKDEAPTPFSGLFIANSVTLSTRVRIEILQAISNVLDSDETESFVQSFSSRPILHYYMREGVNHSVNGANQTYTFVEAVDKFDLSRPIGVLILPSTGAWNSTLWCSKSQDLCCLKTIPPKDPTVFHLERVEVLVDWASADLVAVVMLH